MAFLRFLALLLWLPLAAVAQDGTATFDTQAFDEIAARAETAIDEGAASTEALESLRAQLTEVRSQALARKNAASSRVQPINERIAALGDPPAEGETEPEDVAALRSELQRQLAEARAPVLAAEDAFQRADSLIKRIDTLIRDRSTNALLTLEPTPLNPARWLEAGQALVTYFTHIGNEVSANWESPTRTSSRLSNVPIIAVMIGIALVLLLRARRWSRRAQEVLVERATPRGAALFSFVGAMGQLVLPTIGLVLLVQAINLLDVFGLRGAFLVRAIGFAGFAFLFATWITRLLFVPMHKFPALIEVEETERRSLRNAFLLLGFTFAMGAVLGAMAESEGLESTMRSAVSTLAFPVGVLGGISLIRIGSILRRKAKAAGSREGSNPFLARVSVLIGSFCVLAGVVGPVLSAVGYAQAGGMVVFSSALSLLLIAGFYVLFRLIGMVTGSIGPAVVAAGSEDEQKRYGALFQITLGFFFICAAVPLLALIWGARLSELQEIWLWLRDGIAFGDTRISLTDFLTFILVFSVGYMITRLLQSALRTTVMPNTRLDVGGQNAIVTGTGYVGIFLAALAAITATGLDLSNLAIVAGALSVGIGFGLQTIVSNFVSGIILLIERPIKEGDWIEVGAYSGYVRKISVRSTEVETFDRASVVIPNADLIAGTVTNWTHSSMAGRVRVPVGVAYGTDTRMVERVLREIAEAHPMVIMNPPPAVIFMGFGADSLDFEIRAILRDVNWMLSAKSDMNYEIDKRFKEEGIEIPFAQRDVYIKNLSDLKPGEPLPRGDEPAPEQAPDAADDDPKPGG